MPGVGRTLLSCRVPPLELQPGTYDMIKTHGYNAVKQTSFALFTPEIEKRKSRGHFVLSRSLRQQNSVAFRCWLAIPPASSMTPGESHTINRSSYCAGRSASSSTSATMF